MTYTDEQNRVAIAAVIEAAAPLAVVFPFWVFGFEAEDKWPGFLRSPDDLNSDGKKRVHGYVVTRRNSAGVDSGLCGVKRRAEYLIFGVHYYLTGDSNSRSEDLFGTEIDAITAALDDRLALATVHPELARREPVSWTFNLKSYGGEMVHIAVGTLAIEPL